MNDEIDKKLLLEKRQLSHVEAFTNKLSQVILEHFENSESDDPNSDISEFESQVEEARSELFLKMMDEFNKLGEELVSNYYENAVTSILLDRVQRAYARNQAAERIKREIQLYNDKIGANVLSFDFGPENSMMQKMDDLFMIKQMCAALGVPEMSDQVTAEFIKNMFQPRTK